MANQLYFLAYANTDLKGRSNRGLAEMTVLSPSRGIREKPRLPINSCSNEVIIACQYPCIARVQMPSLSEPGIVTVVKRLLQISKAACRRNGRMEMRGSMREERSLGIS